jgi:hypothetical protein
MRKLTVLLSGCALLGLFGAGLVAQTTTTELYNPQVVGHMSTTPLASGASLPVSTTCPGAISAFDAGSTDFAGGITESGAVTTCTITFGTAFKNVPFCMVVSSTAAKPITKVAPTKTTLVFTHASATLHAMWVCVGT